MVKKIIQKLTIIFALIFVFIPNNSYAITFPSGWVATWGSGSPYFRLYTNKNGWTGWTQSGTQSISSLPDNVFRAEIYDVNGDNYTIRPNTITAVNFSARNCTATGIQNNQVNNSYFRYLGVSIQSAGARGNEQDDVFDITYYYYASNANTSNFTSRMVVPVEFFCTGAPNATTWIKVGGVANFKSNEVKDYTSALNTLNSNLVNINNNLNDIKVNYLDVIIEKMDDQTDQQEQEKQESQQQGEQSQTNSNQAGGDVQQNTTSVLNVITGFFSAFTSARPTNCNMDWGLEDYGFGVIDMCQNPIPQEFQVILSIVSLLFVVPMILWLFSSIINAFKEFQS